jgi:hypothetical protein
MKPGQRPLNELVTVKYAHDIRTLRKCIHCNHPGIGPNMIDHGAGWYHGRCFVNALGRTVFFALPEEKVSRLTVGDLGWDLMKALVNRTEAK